MQPVVAHEGAPRPVLHLANDASCTGFFFSSVTSLIWLFCLCPASPKRHHHVVQGLANTSFLHCSHQTNKFTPCMKSVFSYLAAEAFKGGHSKTSHM